MSRDSDVGSTPPRARNMSTCLHVPIDGPRVSAHELAEAWRRVGDLLERMPYDPSTPLGYKLFWTSGDGTEIGLRDLPAGGGNYAIFGRHTEAHVRLSGDPEISLRHLLATSYVLDDGSVALRLMDLRAELPFFLDDDEPRRAIVASGPVVARVGRYVVGGIPTNELLAWQAARRGGDGEGPYRIPPGREALRFRVLPSREISRAGTPPTSGVVSRHTRITVLPRPSEIVEVGRVGAGPLPGTSILVADRDGQTATVVLTDQDLALGVLVGRADKCVDRGLRRVLTGEISRTHVLLLREHGATWAFDLASTNGTYVQGRRAARVRLSDGGTVLDLAGGRHCVRLRYMRTPRPTEPPPHLH